MHRFAALLAILALVAGSAPAAQAQFSPNVPDKLTTPPPPPAPAPKAFDDGGLSTLQELLIFGAAVAVLGAIAFVIVRDARRRAPVAARPQPTGAGAAKSARERERQQRARRSKAKSARRQRKRNRPR